MRQLLKRFVREEAGMETVEYAILGALFVAGLVTVVPVLIGALQKVFNKVDATVPA